MSGDPQRSTAMTAVISGIVRMPASGRFLLGSVIVVGVALAVLRITFGPGEEVLQASIDSTRESERTPSIVTRTAAPATPAATAAPDATAAAETNGEAATQETARPDAATPEPTPEITDLALGETATSSSNLEITLLDLYTIDSIPQYFGRDMMPRKSIFAIALIRFMNPTSGLIKFSPESVFLVDASDASVAYSRYGTNGVSTIPQPLDKGRPLIATESLLAGGEETVSIVFDLESAPANLRVAIEDLTYAVAVRHDDDPLRSLHAAP